MKISVWEVDEEDRKMMKAMSTHFNIYYNNHSRMLEILSSVPFYNKRFKKEILSFLTNIIRAIKIRARYVSIPKHKKYYSDNKQGISATRMSLVLDLFERYGYINIFVGGVTNWVDMIGTTTMIEIKEPLINTLRTYNLESLLEPKELVLDKPIVIKCRETDKEISTRGIKGVAMKREGVDLYNLKLIENEFMLNGQLVSSPQYFRSYLNNLETGGRFYEKGGGLQTQSESMRKTITINGHNVVSLDFKALHPSILYSWAREEDVEYVDNWVENEWGGKYDPYGASLPFLKINEDKLQWYRDNINPSYNPVRNLCKYTLMVMLNCKSTVSAYMAVTMEYKDDVHRAERTTSIQDWQRVRYYGIEYEDYFRGQDVCSAVAAYNDPISEHFFSDKGVILQNIDSEILAMVINKLLTEDEQVCIPEHDAVIVCEEIRPQAERYMREAYKRIVGDDTFCYIEVK